MRQHLHFRAIFLPLILLFLVFGGCDESNITETDRAGATEITSPADDTSAKRGGVSAARGHIVVFADGVTNPAAEAEAFTRRHGGSVGFVYSTALKGYSVQGLPEQAVQAISRSPRVAYVETDDPVSLFAQTVPTGVRRIFANSNANLDIDGIDDARVDVDVAIIDTGIDFEHPDLNVVGGVDCTVSSGGGPPWARTYYCSDTEGTGGDDDHYHGTHVAGTVAAIDNGIGVVGIAPGARLLAVKVLDSSGSGYQSGIIAGIDWIAEHGEIEVANMSLGGSGFSQAEYDAIQNAVNTGVAFAVAAGNSDDDASNYSPAAFDNSLTVSALADFNGEAGGGASPTCRNDQDDTLADFSNWGSVVDIAAPGVCILSTFPVEQGEYGTISGTSMASPHVAGALALLASVNPASNASGVANLYNDVMNAGNSNWTDDSGDGIKEPLLDVGNTSLFDPSMIGDGGGTPNTPPSVLISSPADGSSFDFGTSISFSGSASDTEDGTITSDLVWTSDLDGQFGTGGSFGAVLSDGTHLVTATVTDSDGAPGSDAITVTVNAATSNTPPSVNISSPSDGATFASGTSISFSGSASDPEDGDLTSNLAWTSSINGSIGSGGSFSTTLSSGTHTITASVTDSGSESGSDAISITVEEENLGGGEITLSASGYKVRGRKHADLSWSGATSTDVDVYRDGAPLVTTANNGAYTNSTSDVGGGSWTYQVCEAGTTTCSNTATVNF